MGNRRYTNFASDSSREDLLARIALDLSRTSDHAADDLWRQLNPELWERTQNPWAVLQTVSGERLGSITSRPEFCAALDEVNRARREAHAGPRWFQRTYPQSPLKCAAYFSMEYMLSEALPIYSGGLGNVAGDQLKAANDLGVPVVAVGLLYSQGYFRQDLDRNGAQRALYPFNDPGQLPIRPVRDENGDWVRFTIPFPGCDLWLRAWEAQVGGARLLLIDANDPANFPEYRVITGELYGGGPDLRLCQERVLGIGGWRLLRALGIRPEVCHLNEGHAAFAVLERAAAHMEETGDSFAKALTITRAGNLFTTHTPVEAGFDRFSEDLMRPHFEPYCAQRLRISFDELMALGRRNAADHGEPFNLAYLALRASGAVNAVSRLHGAVSRGLFSPLFPRWPVSEVPVAHVTNGVHVPTWHSAEAEGLWTGACGEGCWSGDLGQLAEGIRQAPGASIWSLRTRSRESLVQYVRARYARQVAIEGGSAQEIAGASGIFRPDALTLGFARRFASYKRPNLLLHDRDRLLRILRDSSRPVQLVIAGKAHPQDGEGQRMIQEWTGFVRGNSAHGTAVFLSDYDMGLTSQMVSGVDVWINTPRRPWEASGTSGMKVLANGGLNLSELDGWWAEAYAPELGWAVGDGREHDADPDWDVLEAGKVYDLLEQQVVPEFYERDGAGLPQRWLARVRESMARLTPEYSANRAVRQYTGQHYVPAAVRFAARAADGGKLGGDLLAWRENVQSHWRDVRFGPVTTEVSDGRMRFSALIHLGGIDPDSIRVELFAEARDGSSPETIVMDRGAQHPDGSILYSAQAKDDRSAADFTPRVLPHHPAASVPLEAGEILWQK